MTYQFHEVIASSLLSDQRCLVALNVLAAGTALADDAIMRIVIIICVALWGCTKHGVRCEQETDGCACFANGDPNNQTCRAAAGFCCADPAWPDDGICSCENAHCERFADGRCECKPESYFGGTPGTMVDSCTSPAGGTCCLESGACSCGTRSCSGDRVPSCDMHQLARGCGAVDTNNALEVASCPGM
jgi:hypothetical protein